MAAGEQADAVSIDNLTSLETTVLRTLCLTINTAGSELKYKILDSLSEDDFYFAFHKVLFRTLDSMHRKGDYVVFVNLDEELETSDVEPPDGFSLEELFRGELPELSQLNGWILRIKERSRSGVEPSATPPPSAEPESRVRSTPSAEAAQKNPEDSGVDPITGKVGKDMPTMIRSAAEVRKQLGLSKRGEKKPKPAPSRLEQSSPSVPAEAVGPKREATSGPVSRAKIDSALDVRAKSAPSAVKSSPRATSPKRAVLSSEGDDWSSYMDELASMQGKTFETGFKRMDEATGGLSPGVVVLIDEQKDRLHSFLKQLTDQMASGGELCCLYVAYELPKAALRIRTLSRLASVAGADIEKGRLKKDSAEWRRIDHHGREASGWLKRVFVYEADADTDIAMVRQMVKKLIESSDADTALLVVDSLEQLGGKSVTADLSTLAESIDVVIIAGTTDASFLAAKEVAAAACFREADDGSVELEVLQAGQEDSTVLKFLYEADFYRFNEQ